LPPPATAVRAPPLSALICIPPLGLCLATDLPGSRLGVL
jgi:hypothetical protein